MVLLGDKAQVEARFDPFRHCANLDSVCAKCAIRLGNYFGHTRWNSLVMWVMWNLASIHLEIVLVSVQDSCIVRVERTIGSEIILDAPYGTLGHEAQVEGRFGLFGDSANLDAR
jgi:hypothetical protein